MRWRAFYPGVTSAVLLAMPLSAAGQGSVDLITVQGAIDPIIARFATRAIASATDDYAGAVIIQMDTPGGLDVSMRQIVQAIIGSPVPVIVYVAPPGARAGSAGVFITMAAHVAAMAPGTNIGAAHPVSIGGAPLPTTQEEKILNDAAAYIKTLAARRGRNVGWAEEAVRQSVSVTEEEALKLRVIDLIAKDVNDLLTQIDGRKVSTAQGEKILHTRAAKLRERSMSLPERFLHAIVDPNVAYFLFILGLWALIAEFSHPGAILPGVTGVICLILAFVAFGSLPVNWAGVALIVFGLMLFVLDINVTSFALGVGGAIAFILGSLMVFKPWKPTPPTMPAFSVDLRLVGLMAAGLISFFAFVVSKAVQAQRATVTSGMQALIGARGRAVTTLAPLGTVLVGGEQWSAEAVQGTVNPGEEVTVMGSDGLRLRVVKVQEPSEEPK
jgi:membrane-bound serine protease (ClpP class)